MRARSVARYTPRDMPLSRFGRAAAPPRAISVGAVYASLSGDAWAREQLGAIYRKLFEAGGARRGPDHFLYVKPSRARCEIKELSDWVREHHGPPGGRVPAATPFGYLSSRWEGWLTLFAALAEGRDDDLRRDFGQSVAPMSWLGGAARAVSGRHRFLMAASTVPLDERREPEEAPRARDESSRETAREEIAEADLARLRAAREERIRAEIEAHDRAIAALEAGGPEIEEKAARRAGVSKIAADVREIARSNLRRRASGAREETSTETAAREETERPSPPPPRSSSALL